MQRGKAIWYTMAATSVVSLLLLGSGALLAVSEQSNPSGNQSEPAEQSASDNRPAVSGDPLPAAVPGNPSPTAVPAASPANASGDYRVLALGDSLTRGTGDETGQGYVGFLTAELQKMTKNKVITTNLAINGLQTPELLQYVKSPEVQKEIAAANLITLSIGGNDLVKGAGLVAASPDPELAANTRESFLGTLDQVLKEIRSRNEKAPLLFVGLYNPFPLSGENQRIALEILNEWNLQSSRILSKYPATLLLPTQDLFVWNGSKLLAADQFHPNTEGYRAIAERMVQDLK